ncbi:MAG: tRNA (adenosine(37)-N6)-threonylcarbamoyltransferase complex dimerization subunit type 1 TsaB, partial [Sphingomonadaceae bacterium]|nr:tRNA (adenosine(37)-N6)-threonylcarbamoyltransferase complex dimerization subunit type 1 TsaB [Sphingomonadaceae bacterium]
CGPGSFTGIRVGVAAARGLALGWGVPAAGFSALALIAGRADGDEEIVAAMPAGHGELFVQGFARDPFRPVGAVASLAPDAARRFAGDREIVEDSTALDARHAADLPKVLRLLPPAPIYGRAPDARPRA